MIARICSFRETWRKIWQHVTRPKPRTGKELRVRREMGDEAVEIVPKKEWKIVIGRNRCRADSQAFPRRAGFRRLSRHRETSRWFRVGELLSSSRVLMMGEVWKIFPKDKISLLSEFFRDNSLRHRCDLSTFVTIRVKYSVQREFFAIRL